MKIGQMEDIHGARRGSQSKLWITERQVDHAAQPKHKSTAPGWRIKKEKESDEMIALG